MQLDGLTNPWAKPKIWTDQTASRAMPKSGVTRPQRGRLTGRRPADATLSVESEQHGN